MRFTIRQRGFFSRRRCGADNCKPSLIAAFSADGLLKLLPGYPLPVRIAELKTEHATNNFLEAIQLPRIRGTVAAFSLSGPCVSTQTACNAIPDTRGVIVA